jgi:hypothetical protein
MQNSTCSLLYLMKAKMEVYMYLCISMYIYIYAYILCTHIICTIDCQSHYHMLFVSRACNAQIMANMCLFA